MPLQFPFSYPLFTERTLKKNERDTNWQQNRNINSGVYYRNSIYYVWFEYLRSTAMEKFWKQSAQYFGYESLQVSEYTIDEQMDNNFVYLKIPFRQKAKSINKQIATLLTKKRKAFQLKRGRTKRQFVQKAECVPTTDKVQHLKFALEVYELKHKNPKLKLWQISQKMYDAYGKEFSKLHLTEQHRTYSPFQLF